MFRDEQTIVALCTPQGSGAIALLRLSGENAVNIASAISSKNLADFLSHTIHYAHLTNKKGEVVDEVLLLLMKAPNSFTGEDTVEITCHNNVFIIEQIIELAISYGARLALPGEFTKRAVLNGKIDLVQAESIHDIITAQTDSALRISMQQISGTLSQHLYSIENDVTKILAYVEATFEFLDEEQRDLDLNKDIKNELSSIIQKVQLTKDSFHIQKQIKEGVRISLLGSVNAGKSTLFNSLLKQERAIVTPVAGTTRDTIEASLYRNGTFLTFIDTAGLRETDNFIEKTGIERSFKEAEKADIILLVFDASKPLYNEEEIYLELLEKYLDKLIIVGNKVDLSQVNSKIFQNVIYVSANKNIGIDILNSMIDEKIQNIFKSLQSPFLLNKRQYRLLFEVEKELISICKKNDYELMAYSLKNVLELLMELTGKNVQEKVLEEVFSGFCVGK